jgi:cell division protein FtsB
MGNENLVPPDLPSVAEMLRITGGNTAQFMEQVAAHIDKLEEEIVKLRERVAELEKQNSDMGWELNPDRMGK